MAYMSKHPRAFEEAVRLMLTNKKPVAWRAVWIVGSCMGANDPRVRKHSKKLISLLPACSDGHQRELLKVIEKAGIQKNLEGMLFDQCMSIWEKTGKQSSVRITALHVMAKIAERHPDLKKEIAGLVTSHYTDSLSPAIRKTAVRIAKQLQNADSTIYE